MNSSNLSWGIEIAACLPGTWAFFVLKKAKRTHKWKRFGGILAAIAIVMAIIGSVSAMNYLTASLTPGPAMLLGLVVAVGSGYMVWHDGIRGKHDELMFRSPKALKRKGGGGGTPGTGMAPQTGGSKPPATRGGGGGGRAHHLRPAAAFTFFLLSMVWIWIGAANIGHTVSGGFGTAFDRVIHHTPQATAPAIVPAAHTGPATGGN
jgi:hypothetical protein